jgi:hypothetical protein
MIPLRGQSAVEYMMTYGWGILVVLIAGIVIWQMGIFVPQTPTPDKRGFSQVTPLDWSLTPTGILTVVIQNNAGTIVKVTQADAFMEIGGSGTCTIAWPTTVPLVDNFRPGATQMLNFTGCTLDSGTKIGTYYRVNMTVSYLNPSSGMPHRSNGIIWGPLG